jgi:hypothetical protein
LPERVSEEAVDDSREAFDERVEPNRRRIFRLPIKIAEKKAGCGYNLMISLERLLLRKSLATTRLQESFPLSLVAKSALAWMIFTSTLIQ